MKNSRKIHSPKFKSKIALEALSHLKTIATLASKYELHPTQITKWKRHLEKRAEDLFEGERMIKKQKKEYEKQIDRFQQQIRKQEAETNWLKKKLDLSPGKKIKLIDPNHSNISIKRQSELLNIGRSTIYYKTK